MNNVNSIFPEERIIRSPSVLYLIDIMYQKYNRKREFKEIYAPGTRINFNQRYFEEDVVSACTAIYIHNLPKEYFIHTKIDRTKALLAFLLKLSDCLQEWERPSKTNPTGFSASSFDIKVDGKKLVFQTEIPDEEKQHMEDQISSTLIASDVEIC